MTPKDTEAPMTTSLLSPDTATGAALRLRPRLADALSPFGSEPWERPERPLRDLFRNRDDLRRFLEHAARLPVPAADSPWTERPVSHLADHLTQEHRDFFLVMVPDIAERFREWDTLDPEIVDRREEFDAFARALRREADAEEAFLFPRVMHCDACLRDPGRADRVPQALLAPKVEAAFRATETAGPRPELLRRIADRLRDAHAVQQGEARGELLAARLEDFHARLVAHERLEHEVLHPMAAELEKTLYALALPAAAHGVEAMA